MKFWISTSDGQREASAFLADRFAGRPTPPIGELGCDQPKIPVTPGQSYQMSVPDTHPALLRARELWGQAEVHVNDRWGTLCFGSTEGEPA